eukprot:gene339-6753_t
MNDITNTFCKDITVVKIKEQIDKKNKLKNKMEEYESDCDSEGESVEEIEITKFDIRKHLPKEPLQLNFDETVSNESINCILSEFIETEQSYVKGLDFVEKFYLCPLEILSKTNMISENIIKNIRYPLIDILTLHKEILKELELKEYSIGEIFITVTNYFKRYSNFAKNYHETFEYFTNEMKENENLYQFIDETKRNNKKNGFNDLFSILITPIQRLPRYLLLLNEFLNELKIIENKTKEIKKEIELIEICLEKLKVIITYLNDSIKNEMEIENLKKIFDSIQNLPKYLLFSRFKRKLEFEKDINLNFYENCKLFFFNDLIIFTDQKLNFLNYISISKHDIPILNHFEHQSILIKNSEKKFLIKFKSYGEKIEVSDTLFKIINELSHELKISKNNQSLYKSKLNQ